jgi:P-type Ca2+ transporter type 2C
MLLGVVFGSVLLQLAIHHIPWAQSLFEIGAISTADCVLTLGLGLVPVTVIELLKLASQRRST